MFAGDVASEIEDGTGGGAIPLSNDCGPKAGLNPVGSVAYNISGR
jgi:hypothetical protein